MDDSVEIVLEKLLHVTKDVVAKVSKFFYVYGLMWFHICSTYFFLPCIQVSNEAEQCLTVVLSQYDPFRCLTVCLQNAHLVFELSRLDDITF